VPTWLAERVSNVGCEVGYHGSVKESGRNTTGFVVMGPRYPHSSSPQLVLSSLWVLQASWCCKFLAWSDLLQLLGPAHIERWAEPSNLQVVTQSGMELGRRPSQRSNRDVITRIFRSQAGPYADRRTEKIAGHEDLEAFVGKRSRRSFNLQYKGSCIGNDRRQRAVSILPPRRSWGEII